MLLKTQTIDLIFHLITRLFAYSHEFDSPLLFSRLFTLKKKANVSGNVVLKIGWSLQRLYNNVFRLKLLRNTALSRFIFKSFLEKASFDRV